MKIIENITVKVSQTVKQKITKKYLTGCQGDPYYLSPIYEKKNYHHYSGLLLKHTYPGRDFQIMSWEGLTMAKIKSD